jgi:hypothetical protein
MIIVSMLSRQQACTASTPSSLLSLSWILKVVTLGVHLAAHSACIAVLLALCMQEASFTVWVDEDVHHEHVHDFRTFA